MATYNSANPYDGHVQICQLLRWSRPNLPTPTMATPKSANPYDGHAQIDHICVQQGIRTRQLTIISIIVYQMLYFWKVRHSIIMLAL